MSYASANRDDRVFHNTPLATGFASAVRELGEGEPSLYS